MENIYLFTATGLLLVAVAVVDDVCAAPRRAASRREVHRRIARLRCWFACPPAHLFSFLSSPRDLNRVQLCCVETSLRFHPYHPYRSGAAAEAAGRRRRRQRRLAASTCPSPARPSTVGLHSPLEHILLPTPEPRVEFADYRVAHTVWNLCRKLCAPDYERVHGSGRVRKRWEKSICDAVHFQTEFVKIFAKSGLDVEALVIVYDGSLFRRSLRRINEISRDQ